MKIFSKIISIILMFVVGWISVHAWIIDDLFDSGRPQVWICQDDDCNLQWGVEQVWDHLGWVVTDQTASSYIQEVIIFLIGFISLIAVIYIIYAWFNIMIGSWDEEKIKKSKSTIFYVIIGLLVIYFAYTIVAFVFDVFDTADDIVTTISSNIYM